MAKNYITQSIPILLVILFSLFLLSLIGEFKIGNVKIKKVNILKDIQIDPILPKVTPQMNQVDSIISTKSQADPIDTTYHGIEDFSPDKSGLGHFFSSLKNSRTKPVRVAFFGDSFIEGDILCANFRDTLQHLFGGRGVGFVPITSEVSKFRTTIQHNYTNWKTFSIVGEKNNSFPLGTSGYCFVPLEENEVEYKPAQRGRSSSFRHVKLFLRNTLASNLSYTINDTLTFDQPLEADTKLQEYTIAKENIQSVKFQFKTSDSLLVYGTSFEEPTGIYVDNFAMRGNSGIGLYQITTQKHREFNSFRDYKLIILQYGLNVVNETDTTGYAWYVERMATVIKRLKESFPSASFLLLSVSDRSSNQEGKFETIPAITVMRDAQRLLARKTKITFWDVYTAMGGKNSMIKYVTAKPPLAAKDYTHLTYWGGKKIAKLLADALLAEKKRYDRS